MQLTLALLFALLLCLPFCAYGEQRANSVLLNGDWECVVGDGTEAEGLPAGQAALAWRPVRVPGFLLPMTDQTAGKTNTR
jgi:hypothetical protein